MGIEGVLNRAAYLGDDYHPLDSEIVLGALKSLFHRVFCVASHLLW